MLLSEAIDRYLADRRAKGYALNTVRGNGYVLKALLADCGNIQVSSLSPRHMDTFWSRHGDWSPGQFNRVRSVLSTFFQWCRVRGHMPRALDPMEGLRKQKPIPRDWLILPQEKFGDVLDAAVNPRDRVLIALGLYLFTRVSESVALRWQDLKFQTDTISVYRTKTRTLDPLPMCSELEHELKRWRLTYGELMGRVPEPGWYVVPAYESNHIIGWKDGRPVTNLSTELTPTKMFTNGTKRVQITLREAGYTTLEREGSHTLRRSGATALYHELARKGHDRAIRMCQAMLGHSSIRNTEVYLRLDLDRKASHDLLGGVPMFQTEPGGEVVPMGNGVVGRDEGVNRHLPM